MYCLHLSYKLSGTPLCQVQVHTIPDRVHTLVRGWQRRGQGTNPTEDSGGDVCFERAWESPSHTQPAQKGPEEAVLHWRPGTKGESSRMGRGMSPVEGNVVKAGRQRGAQRTGMFVTHLVSASETFKSRPREHHRREGRQNLRAGG